MFRNLLLLIAIGCCDLLAHNRLGNNVYNYRRYRNVNSLTNYEEQIADWMRKNGLTTGDSRRRQPKRSQNRTRNRNNKNRVQQRRRKMYKHHLANE